jgi:hypothetical protein
VTADDWLLALHVLSGFALVAGIVVFWVVIVAVRRMDTPEETLRARPLTLVAESAIGVGAVGTVVLGLALALSDDDHDPRDGWIVAALVLWVVLMGLGQRTGAAYRPAVRRALELRRSGAPGADAELRDLNRTPRGLLLQCLVSAVVLLILADMLWKPGA